MTDQPLVFVSSNPNKAIEAERILSMPLLRVDIALPEIQAATLEEITRHKLELARTRGYQRLIVEDVSLGFDELGNFPGPYIHWLLKAAGGRGLGAIAYALRDPGAIARCCVGYFDGEEIRLLTGETRGRILVEPRGESGFGWDAWFLPDGETKTYAELDAARKDAISHRGRAYRQLRGLLVPSVQTDGVIGNEDAPEAASGEARR
ncbi:MAG TPA: non-canonical purine NTP pyrophosphatase [Thermoanaerobaculia bacterium]